jgi:hypothetical protein
MIVKSQRNVFRFVNVYVYNCDHGYTHNTSLYTIGVMFEPGVIDLLEVSVHVLSIFTVYRVMNDFICLYTYEF